MWAAPVWYATGRKGVSGPRSRPTGCDPQIGCDQYSATRAGCREKEHPKLMLRRKSTFSESIRSAMLSFNSERPRGCGAPGIRPVAPPSHTRSQTGVIGRKIRPAWCCSATRIRSGRRGPTLGRPKAGHGAAVFGSARHWARFRRCNCAGCGRPQVRVRIEAPIAGSDEPEGMGQ